MIRIAIVDDELLLLNLLKEFFEQQPSIHCLFTATSGEALLERLKKEKQLPDIILLDLKMKGMNGAETADKLRHAYPQIHILIMSTYYQDTFLNYMLRMGAAAFLPKDISPNKLVKAIHSIHEKGVYFTLEQLALMRHQITQAPIAPKLTRQDELTSREKEVLILICQQRTTNEIADTLFISKRTVDTHRNNLFAKTNAKNVVGLVIYAIQHQLIDETVILSLT